MGKSKKPPTNTDKHLSTFELFQQFKETNNPNLLVQILDRHQTSITGSIVKLIKDDEDIKDIKQELYFKLVNKLGEQNFTGEQHFGNWIKKVTQNYITDKYFRKKRPETTDEFSTAFVNDFPEIDLKLDFDHVRSCIESLRPAQQMYIELKFFQNMSNKEISAHMNWTDNQTRGTHDRAIKNLKKRLIQTGLGGELTQHLKSE
ncbi:MAG: sigma-70 family RNA polymerase sigma factor [Bacteroidota bacterium]